MIERNLERFGDKDENIGSVHFLDDEAASYESMSSIDSYDDHETITKKRRMVSIKKMTNRGNYNVL
jgi:hypothetical protein